MCFSCAPVAVECGDSCRIRLSRIADHVSTPYETGFSPEEAARFGQGQWLFVGLLGELVDEHGAVRRSEVVWGIREDDENRPCAFGFTAGVAWLLEHLVANPVPATVLAS